MARAASLACRLSDARSGIHLALVLDVFRHPRRSWQAPPLIIAPGIWAWIPISSSQRGRLFSTYVVVLSELYNKVTALIVCWCGRRGSNPHDQGRGILSPLRLPVSPRPRCSAILLAEADGSSPDSDERERNGASRRQTEAPLRERCLSRTSWRAAWSCRRAPTGEHWRCRRLSCRVRRQRRARDRSLVP